MNHRGKENLLHEKGYGNGKDDHGHVQHVHVLCHVCFRCQLQTVRFHPVHFGTKPGDSIGVSRFFVRKDVFPVLKKLINSNLYSTRM